MVTPLDLCTAAFNGDTAALTAGLSATNADTRHPDRGSTLLYTAARFGHLAAVQLLLARGASVNAPNAGDDRSTPLHGACYGGHAPIVAALVAAGADLNSTNAFGERPADNSRKPATGVTKAAKTAVIAALSSAPPPAAPGGAPPAVANAAAGGGEPFDQLMKLTIAQLRQRATAAGLPPTGTKAVLATALVAAAGSGAAPATPLAPGSPAKGGKTGAMPSAAEPPTKAPKLEPASGASEGDGALPAVGVGYDFDMDTAPSCEPATVRRWLEAIDKVPEDTRPSSAVVDAACANERCLLGALQRDQPGCVVKAGPVELITGLCLYASDKQIAGASRQLRRELVIHHRDDAATGFIAVPRRGLRVGGAGDLALPLSAADAAALYGALEPAKLGVEGAGDVLDESKRKSRDLPCDAPGVVLPPALQSLPVEALAALRPVLAPGRARLDAVPYKIVGYRSGDFFSRHVDASEAADHVGTLTLHLPCAGDGADGEVGGAADPPLSLPVALARDRAVASVVPADAASPASALGPAAAAAASGGDEDAPSGAAVATVGPFGTVAEKPVASTASGSSGVGDVERLKGGELVLYTGRDPANPRLLRNADCDDNEYPYAPAHFGRLSSGELVVQLAEYRGAPSVRDAGVPCKFAAWLKDVPHEVRPLGGDPVETGKPPLPGTRHRVVVTYKLYARGPTIPMALPRRRQLVGLVDEMFGAIAAASATKLAALPEGDDTEALKELNGPPPGSSDDDYMDQLIGGADPTTHHGRRFLPRRVGFLLHHCYAPAELSAGALRGVDAALYRTLRAERRCFVVPAFWRRSDYCGTPFKLTTEPARLVLAGANPKVKEDSGAMGPAGFVESSTSGAYFLPQNPVLAGVAWVAVGHGSYVNGGTCYGNCDCPTDWYYRGAALVVCPERSLARWAWAIARRGGGGWRKAASEAVTLRTLCEFLG